MRCIAYAASNEWPWIQGRLQILNDTGYTASLPCRLYRALLLVLYPCVPRDDSSSIFFYHFYVYDLCNGRSVGFFFYQARMISEVNTARACVSGSSYQWHWTLSGLFPVVYSLCEEWSVWAAAALVEPAERGKAEELGQCHETKNFPCHLKPCGIYKRAKRILPHYSNTY